VSIDLGYGTAWDGYSIDYLYDIEDIAGSYYGDQLWGGVTSNHIFGLGGDDLISGFAGDDALFGGDGTDYLSGGAGADQIDGGEGSFHMAGYINATAGVVVSLDSGFGYSGEALGDALYGIENLGGSVFGDSLTGNGSANFLLGEAGNDILNGGAGADRMV